MEGRAQFKLGHLKIVDHLIMGIASHLLDQQAFHLDNSSFETVAFNAWDPVCDALCQGDINGAFLPAPAAMDLFARGLDICLIMLTHRSGSRIVRKNIATVKTIQDFRDRIVLIPHPLSVQHMLLHRLMVSAGLDPGPGGSVGVETVPPYLMPAMLGHDEDDDIAGFAVAEPYADQAMMEKTALPMCTTDHLWEGHPCCVFVMDRTTAQGSPKAMKKLVLLFLEAAQQLNTEQSRLHRIISDFLDQDPHRVDSLLHRSRISFDPGGLTPDIPALEIIRDYMSGAMGMLAPDIDLNRFVAPEFMPNLTLEAPIEN